MKKNRTLSSGEVASYSRPQYQLETPSRLKIFHAKMRRLFRFHFASSIILICCWQMTPLFCGIFLCALVDSEP
jgi:hypothetical protein